TLGYNSYVGKAAPSGLLSQYGNAALSTDWFDKQLMTGLEGQWFFTDRWALRLGGGLGFTHNPGYAARPGTFDEDSEVGDGSIPDYQAVGNADNLKYNVYTGFDRYFQSKKVNDLYFHIGLQAGFAYGLNRMNPADENTMGTSTGEAFNIRGAFNMGVDYYILPAMFLGLEVSPLAYTYNMTTIKPQPGLRNLSADSHNFAFLAAPILKIGFHF
ncbi:MAG: hypothetical protein K2M86_02180, partial [Odoribacter sp.]|nr:hypothetical protein [Odoribacter sp.]